MNIGIICHQNLARSQLLVSYLRKNFREHSFFSAGISNSQGLQFPQNVTTLAKSWNLPLNENPNQDLLNAKNLISNADLIICADDYVFEYCQLNILDKRMINLRALADKFELTIYDPFNLQMSQFKTMIAKYIFLCNELMYELEGSSKRLITVIPNEADELDAAFEAAKSKGAQYENSIIIDYNLRVPNVNLTKVSNNSISIVKQNLLEHLKPSCSVINTFGVELINPELTYLDYYWRQQVRSLSEKFTVILVMPPRHVHGVEMHDIYLSSLTR
jgi:protein-tyrosine-phosphatase